MKTIFTLLSILACIFLPLNRSIAQCNYTSGGNGQAVALPAGITIDGNMGDWAPYLSDPDNNAYDNTSGSDLDAPISDAGRDLSRFSFTEDANNVFIYLERVGSSNNTVDILFYADINNNGVMELNEPVVHINWSGASGNVSLSITNYVPSVTSLLNNISSNLDGSPLWGTLVNRVSNIGQGKGSADGRTAELRIPFSQLSQLNILGGVINQLSFGQDFKYHISTINGNISSIPNANSINDNFGGCLRAPLVILPLELLSFNVVLKNTSDKVDLKWVTTSEKNVSHFEVERSIDGVNYSQAAIVFAYGNTNENKTYTYSDDLNNVQSKIIYYRVRSVDIDGRSQLSQARVVRISKLGDMLKLATYPNPVTNELRITVPATWQNKEVMLEVFNQNGQKLKSFTIGNASQTEIIAVSELAKGFYFVKATCGVETAQQKIVKQ